LGIQRKLLRAVLAVATVMVVWLVASPASAAPINAAPLCDPRGAIGFAPPPQFQDEERSLDIPVSCLPEASPLDTKNVVPGHHSGIELSFSQEPLASGARLVVPAAPPTMRVPVAEVTAARLPPGVRASLDRPPQA
jgi:hypothetical protein